MNTKERWYALNHPEQVATPCLLVYPDRIKQNIDLMIHMAGDVNRLRPHVKTHKTAEIIQLQMAKGIEKFKCATIAEAELLGMCSAPDVLLAMQPVGPNIPRFIQLVKSFPLTRFSTLVDNEESVMQLSGAAADNDCSFGVFLDLNTGMDRTGIAPGEEAANIFRKIWTDPLLRAEGLHTYDGHIRNEDLAERQKLCDEAFALVEGLRSAIEAEGMEVKSVVAGGSPSFPVHSKREGVEVSPGTTLLWDERYHSSFKEMGFLPAAVLLCRIVSKPKENLLCLDLGHKSIAPEMDFPRVKIFGLEDCQQIGQSEEHLVVRCQDVTHYSVGDVFYAIPMHICPTVAKYGQLHLVEGGEITGNWQVAARNHKLTI